MKKIKILALALLATAITFSSCKKDEEEKTGPALTVTSNTSSVWLGDSIVVSYNITSNEKIEKLNWSASNTGVTSGTYETTDFNGDYSATGTVVFNVTAVEADLNGATSVTLSFTAEDKDGVEYANTKTVSVALEDDTMTAMTDEQSGTLFHILGTGQGAWDLVANTGVSASGDDADKDMIHVTDGNSDTFNQVWEAGAGNETMYVLAAGFDYDNATVEAAMAAYDGGTASASVTFAMDEIYVAKLRGGSDYAVIKVTAINPSAGDNEDSMNFTYKK